MTEPIVAIVRKSNKWPSVRSFNIHTLPQPAHRHHRARAAVSARPDVDSVETLDTLDSVHTLDSVRTISPCGHWTLWTGHVAAETERGHHAAPAAPPPGGPAPRPRPGTWSTAPRPRPDTQGFAQADSGAVPLQQIVPQILQAEDWS